MLTKIDKQPINMIISSHTTTNQQPFSSNQIKQKGISKNKFRCENSTQHNLQNNKSFSLIQSLKCSWQGGLQDAYQGFGKG